MALVTPRTTHCSRYSNHISKAWPHLPWNPPVAITEQRFQKFLNDTNVKMEQKMKDTKSELVHEVKVEVQKTFQEMNVMGLLAGKAETVPLQVLSLDVEVKLAKSQTAMEKALGDVKASMEKGFGDGKFTMEKNQGELRLGIERIEKQMSEFRWLLFFLCFVMVFGSNPESVVGKAAAAALKFMKFG